MMKKIVLLAAISILFSGCNMNPSKEERIQKLETELQQSLDKIGDLEIRIQTLEGQNEELRTRILALEDQ
jgi:PBP1b-binding outer membrane lipoprotein LpoB